MLWALEKIFHLLRENIGMIHIQQIQKKTITLPKTNVAPENGGFQ